MITITRSLARHLRAVFRRADIKSRGSVAPPLWIQAGADGLRIQTLSNDIEFEYHLPGELASEELGLPVSVLDDCQGRTDEAVTIEARPKKKVVADWQDRGIPQHAEYDAVARRQSLSASPERFTLIEQSFWQALRDAGECTDRESSRYALGNVHLRSAGGLVTAADGWQLFQHGGFQFPWTGDVMVPALRVLGCPELAGTGPLEIGKTDKHLALRIARWTLLLTIDSAGRFPKIEETLQAAEAGPTTLSLAAADAEFLSQALPRLPHNDELVHRAITLDINGQALVRAQAAKSSPITELVLANTTCVGEPLRIQMNSGYLEHALKLGLTSFRFKSAESAVLGFDDRRRFVWMPLTSEHALGPAQDAIRIESAAAAAGAAGVALSSQRSTPKTNMPKTHSAAATSGDVTIVPSAGATPAASSEPQAESRNELASQGSGDRPARRGRTRKPSKSESSGAIEQAIALRDILRESVNQTNELISTLKRQRQQSRLVQSTLASLKELQRAG